jgi:hypothetical protein
MFLQSYGVFANFCAKYFANFFATNKNFLQFIWYSFYTAIFILQSSHVIVEQF